MKKVFFALAVAAASLFTIFTAQAQETKIAEIADKVSFIGVNSAELELGAKGEMLLKTVMVYENKYKNELTISSPTARILILDKTFQQENPDLDAFKLVFSDFCKGGKNMPLKPYYESYDCGVYLPEQRSAKQSINFKKGRHEMKLQFKISPDSLINEGKTNLAAEKIPNLNTDAEKVCSVATLKNMVRLYNALNGIERSKSKLVILFEGIANDGNSVIVELPSDPIRLVCTLGHDTNPYIFTASPKD